MAKFKLYLINLNTVKPDHEPTYFKQVISEFYDQRTEYLRRDLSPVYTYCYTYNEKFQESTNSQKTLSFSMDRKIIRDDRIEDNPFVYNIAIGTQLLLEDKYGRQHLMTVKDIKFDFKEFNLTYNFQCQDSFTWQLSRQSDGYEITNDASSEDFLGAKNIDDWTRKICTECNVVYTYRGFIDDVNNELSSIKDFNKTIPFSGSGTADSMLISLAEQYGLQLKVYEHFNDDNNTITKEFSYIPLKSFHPSGLKYSPYYDIQSFGLTHNGTALSSVLNVKSNMINDEVISLIPSVPAFFKSWFETADWHNSQFSPGMFSNKCRVDGKYFNFHGLTPNIITTTDNTNNKEQLIQALLVPSIVGSLFFDFKEDIWGQQLTWNNATSYFPELGTTAPDVNNQVTLSYPLDFISNDINYNQMEIVFDAEKVTILETGQTIYDFTVVTIKYTNTNSQQTVEYSNGIEVASIALRTPATEENSFLSVLYSSYAGTTTFDKGINLGLYVYLGALTLDSNYPFVHFQSKENQSFIHTEEKRDSTTSFYYHYNTDTIWSLVRLQKDSVDEIRAGVDQIPESWYNTSYEYFIKIPLSYLDQIKILDSEIHMEFYREPTQEEIIFANIADQCPWLENKLFNFDYFYNHQIINRKQYNELQQYIQNDLRKSSAKLLLYTQLYYEQVKAKTENLAKLENQVDTLGAIFNAEFIAPFNERKAFESSDFITAYTSLFVGQTSQGIGLLDYSKTISDYLNKYINAEQTFLKNMYLFKNYFNAKTDFGKLYKYTITKPSEEESLECVSFSKPDSYQKISINSFTNYINENQLPTTQIYEKEIVSDEDGEKEIYMAIPTNELVGLDSMHDSDLYYIDSLEAKFRIEDGNYEYNPDTQYLEEQWVYSLDKNWTTPLSNGPILDETVGMYELYKVDIWNKKAYVRSYQHCIQNKPTESLNFKFDDSNTLTLENPTSIYEKVDIFEMKCNYFYRCRNEDIEPNENINYRRINAQSKLLSDILSASEDISAPWKIPSLFSNNEKNNIKKKFPNYEKYKKEYNDDTTNSFFALLYHANFPLTTVQYTWNETDEETKESKTNITDVDFINYNTAANFYRRISVSNGWKTAIRIGSWLNGPGAIVRAIAELCWRYGNTSWGIEGWTYQNVWGNTFDDNSDKFNEAWTDSEEMIYVKSATSWNDCFPKEYPDSDWVNNKNNNWNSTIAKNILYTPRSFSASPIQEYKYTPYYWRVLDVSNETIIYKNESYKIMFWKETDNLFDSEQLVDRIDAIANYPLNFILNDLPLSDFNSEELKVTDIETVIDDLIPDDDEEGYKWAILHEEHYDEEYLINNEDNTKSPLSIYDIYDLARSQWYTTNHSLVDFSTINGIAYGFFINKNNENYKSVLDANITTPEELNNKIYYRRNGDSYTLQNTLAQQIAEGKTYTKLGDQTTYVTFEDLDEVQLSVNVYTRKTTNDSWIYKNTEMRTFEISSKEVEDLGSMSNGLFWATYRNELDQSILLQKAMLIETNLTEYWTNAYYASRNCRFFIPQHWQSVINSQINYFSNDILIPITNDNALTDIKLNNKYIPDVSCLSEQPEYIYTYSDKPQQVDTSMEKIYNKQISLETACNNSPWLETIIKYLNIDKSKCIVTIPRYNAAHYTHQSGGKTWYDTLNLISNNQFIDFNKFGGWYDMIIKTLNTRYYSIEMTQYEEARRKHNAAWQYLHRTYPHLIYEKSYENTDATTSEQLLAAAQFAFRQYTDVERQYDIQTIDLAGLKGYEGQHLQVGDAIQLDADELYEAYDDIKTSLLQYLYVSDISYDLRNDANIQLTVNDIKYSDKVIGELVKLIR